MRTYSKKKVAVLLVFCGVIIFGISLFKTPAEREWVALFTGLPEKLATANAYHNATLYVLKQTHEPLFRKDDGQSFDTRILKKWERSVDSRKYIFCQDNSLSFDGNIQFNEKFFSQYISNVTKKYDSSFKLGWENGCAVIVFSKPEKNYLEFLSLYENAPTIKSAQSFEEGLGPFRVVNISKDAILLARKRPVSNGFNKIRLYDYKGGLDPNLHNRAIADFNRIPPFDVPKWVESGYHGFDNVQLKTVNLVVNHPNPDVRRVLYNCIDVKTFRKAYFPKIGESFDVGNVFPMGVPGAILGLPEQVCEIKEVSKINGPVVLANWRDDNHDSLAEFAGKLRSKTGINVKIVNYQPSELIKLLHANPRVYNLLVLGIDAVRPDFEAFLSPFFRADSYLDFELPKVKPLYQKMVLEADQDKKSDLAEKIAKELTRENVVLPLYQIAGKLYYPKGIKNLEVGRGFLEYPEVGDFRW